MKSYKNILMLVMFLTVASFSQTQERIPWPSLADSPWPVGRGDAQATGRSEYVGPKTPNIIWKKTFRFGLLNSPVIGFDGNLLIGTRAWYSTDYDENYFYYTDSAGDIIWQYTTDNWLANNSSPIAASDSTIYFGSQSGAFYALDQNGNLKWKYQSPLNLYSINTLDKEGNIFTTSTDSLICLTPEGKVKFTLGFEYIGGQVAFSPEGDILYLQSFRQENSKWFSYLHAISLEGEIMWSKKFSGLVKGTIMIDNAGLIYVKGAEYNNPDIGDALICLNPNGEIEWQYEVLNTVDFGAPTIDKNGNISFYCAIMDNDVVKMGIVSVDYEGNFRWFYHMDNTPFPENIQHGLVCDADGTIYAGSTWGYYFYAISSEGELLWKIPLNEYYADSSPVISEDGTLYIGLCKGAGDNNLENTLIAIKDNPNSVENEEVPIEFVLHQNYPNPFNPSTTIKFSIPKVSEVKLTVYNTLGQEVAQLLNEVKHPGSYEVAFDGSGLSSGVYIYTLQTPTKRISRKMLLIK